MKNNEKVTIINKNLTTEEVEVICHFAITSPEPRTEYIVFTKHENAGKDMKGNNLFITYISRVEKNHNGVPMLNGITDEDEFKRVQQVLNEIKES